VSVLHREVDAVQNPALGAAIIWRFVCGYCPQGAEGGPTPLPLLFLVLPIVLHSETRALVESTMPNSGLYKFVEKFAVAEKQQPGRNDLLLAIHDRALVLRPLSQDSLKLALATELLSIDPNQAGVFPVTYAQPSAAPERVRPMLKSAEKLGGWCAPLSLFEISRLLRTVF
jgi:hypothetical protein